MSNSKIVVIGAGLSGLCVAKYAQNCGHDVIIFEQEAQLGGTWFYTDEVDPDEYGLDVHTSMYHNLRTNLPKEVMGFDDFPMPQSPRSFLTSDEVLFYLNSYAEHFDLLKLIKYRHQVIRVLPIVTASGTKWEVKVFDLPCKKLETHLYEAIFVCNGRTSCGFTPHFEGIDQFKGKQMHSRSYRRASALKDKTVLIIGGGYSGIDLSYAISKTAKKVLFSHHTHYDDHVFPSNVVKKGKIKSFTKTGVIFADNTEEAITDVVFCTGFRISMPFLSINCGIVVDDSYVSPLYKHCININYPTMAIIGLTKTAAITQMIDIQVRFCMQYLNGNKVLPSKEEMLADTERDIGKRFSVGWSKYRAHCIMGPLQREYYDDLALTANIDSVRDIYTNIYNDCHERRQRNPAKYRDVVYKIVADGKFEIKALSSEEL